MGALSDAEGCRGEPSDHADFARTRRPGRTYITKSFPLKPPSRDAGCPGRFIRKVFDVPGDATGDTEWSAGTVRATTRRQVEVLVGRESGRVKRIVIQEVPRSGPVKEILKLERDDSSRLLDLFRSLDDIPVEGPRTVKVDSDLIDDVVGYSDNVQAAYRAGPQKFADLIARDVNANDVIAVERRRRQLRHMRRLLEDDEFFDRQTATLGKGRRERVWQRFFNENPWVFGIGLSGHLFTSYDPEKLERVVRGGTFDHSSKIVDGLMRTVGALSSLVFAEIKHHRTTLLDEVKEHRPECWAPSNELAGGVTQIQQTVYLATRDHEDYLFDGDKVGGPARDLRFLIRPRSYLVIGSLDELTNSDDSVNLPKMRSFELYRRNLYEPQILTFDELLARAEWALEETERDHQD